MRRIKRMSLADHCLMNFLLNPTPPGLIVHGLPQDSKIIHCQRGAGTVDLILESTEFEEVAPGAVIPEIVPIYQRTM